MSETLKDIENWCIEKSNPGHPTETMGSSARVSYEDMKDLASRIRAAANRENSTITQKSEILSFGDNAKKSVDCGAVAKSLEDAKLKINRIKVPYAGTTYDENGYAVDGEPVCVVDADDALEILGSIEQAVADHFRDAAQMVGNAAKLRETLERIKKFVEGQCEIANDDARAILDNITVALAAPPRNCDVYATYEDALREWDSIVRTDPRWGGATATMAEWLFEKSAQEGGGK